MTVDHQDRDTVVTGGMIATTIAADDSRNVMDIGTSVRKGAMMMTGDQVATAVNQIAVAMGRDLYPLPRAEISSSLAWTPSCPRTNWQDS